MSKTISPIERKKWAALFEINEQYLYQCLTGRGEMSAIEARRIEDLSNGEITRKMVCQKTWFGIWPELAEVA